MWAPFGQAPLPDRLHVLIHSTPTRPSARLFSLFLIRTWHTGRAEKRISSVAGVMLDLEGPPSCLFVVTGKAIGGSSWG